MCIHALAHTERYVVVSWTRLSVTLYLHCLPCYWLKFDVYFWSFHAFCVPSLHSLLKFQVIWFWTPCVSVCLVPELQNITVFLSPLSSSVMVLWNVRNSSSSDTTRHPTRLESWAICLKNLKSCSIVLAVTSGTGCELWSSSLFSFLHPVANFYQWCPHILLSAPTSQIPLILYTPFLSRAMLVPLKVRTWNQTVKSLVVPVENSHSVWMLHIL